MNLKWRLWDACPESHPDSAYRCEQETDHNGDHYYTEWEYDVVTGESCPLYPVYWTSESGGQR